MFNKGWIAGATLSALLACALAGVCLRQAPILDNVGWAARQVATATGIQPLDVARILLILMLAHYLQATPTLLKKAKRLLARSGSPWHRLKCAGHFATHFGMHVAVPSVFCIIVEGGHHAVSTGAVGLIA